MIILSGCYKTFMLNQSCSSICADCPSNRLDCKDKKRARPSLKSFAVDFNPTIRNIGIEINVVTSPVKMNRIALLLSN
ncbi:DUF2284 domain-containing protein [Planctomycetota bacterium]